MATLSITTDGDQQPARLYYLDWLRVRAILGVFLFHAAHPFDLTAWHIKNAEQSVVVTFFIAFMFSWGMAFFFLLAGSGSFFALRRRTAGQFAHERFSRLLRTDGQNACAALDVWPTRPAQMGAWRDLDGGTVTDALHLPTRLCVHT